MNSDGVLTRMLQITDRAWLVRTAISVRRRLAFLRTLTRDRHAWMSYMVDKPPTEDPILQRQVRSWEPKTHHPVLTMTRSAYKPYST